MKQFISDLLRFAFDLLAGPPTRTTNRVRVVKTILWFFLGVAATVAFFRFTRGLGATTALTDVTPWGLWIGFDVLGGVALAAGGFVIAATVYIFHLDRYHPIVRPAVLTAFLGYAAVIVGLLFDLGLPWNIWRPTIYWQHHSALFEVAWCVMLYFTVLALEFAPVVAEKMPFPWLYNILKKFTLPLVILGIMLSTLHQSSLGTLFLIMPHRLHDLWYSPLQPALFFVSAVGLGLGMVTMESLTTSWLYQREPEWPLLRGLAKPASAVLLLYAALRIGDLVVRGKTATLFAPEWETGLFWGEMAICSLVPAALFGIPKLRASNVALFFAGLMVVLGFVLNRISVSGLATIGVTRTNYFPSWTEFAVSLGVVSGAGLVFFFFVEHFSVYEEHEHSEPADPERPSPPAADPVTGVRLAPPWAGNTAIYSLVFVIAAALAFGLLPEGAVGGATPQSTPVAPARNLSGIISQDPGAPFKTLSLPVGGQAPSGETKRLLMINGNDDGRFVLFDHEGHQARQGSEKSCGLCHHLNLPFDETSSCVQCHRDMYVPTDTFSHDFHLTKLGGNDACAKCHQDPAAPKSRETVKPCLQCHTEMLAANARVKPASPPQLGLAPGYMQAMHGLCLDCHRQTAKERPQLTEDFARCAACHRESDEEFLRRQAPYVEGE